ncbi:MAG: serine/threonine-protein kinase [Pseudomonadota bacterium]
MSEEATQSEEVTQVDKIPPMSMQSLVSSKAMADFRIDTLLGQGITGQVFRAQSLIANKLCALKVFHAGLTMGSVVRGRYVHEQKTARNLDHPNIARFFEFKQDSDGRWYSIMELAEGWPLQDLFNKNAPFPRRSLISIFRQLCTALSFTHARGLAHLRLHAANVVICSHAQDPLAKILDFGVWHLHPAIDDPAPGIQRTAKDALCLAPELTKGQVGDNRSDVYSLSVLLYQMVTGRAPFVAESFDATLEKQISESPPPPSQFVSIPNELEETILRGLEKDPRKRIPSVEALLNAIDPLAAISSHSGIKHTPTGRHRVLLDEGSKTSEQESESGNKSFWTRFIPFRKNISVTLPRSVLASDTQITSAESAQLPRKKLWFLLSLIVSIVALVCALIFVSVDTEEPSKIQSTGDKSSRKRVKHRIRSNSTSVPRTGPSTTRKRMTRRQEEARVSNSLLSRPSNEGKTIHAKPFESQAGRFLPEVAKGFGTLTVVTGRPNSRIFVNGKYVGEGPELTLPQLQARTHRVHYVLEGKKQPYKDIKLLPGQKLTVNL